MAHTPGPWRRKDKKIGDRIYRIDIDAPTGSGRGGHPVCSVYAGFTNMEDDANLIVAAPTLEAELAEAKQEIHRLGGQLSGLVKTESRFHRFRDTVEAVIPELESCEEAFDGADGIDVPTVLAQCIGKLRTELNWGM